MVPESSRNGQQKLARAARRNIERERRAKSATLEDQAPAERRSPTYRVILRVIGWILGTPLALLCAIYSFWGPPWPTEPTFSPGFPSSGPPLDVPFIVRNTSALFGLPNMQVFCGIDNVETSIGSGVGTVSVTTGARTTLGRLTTASYTCPFSKVFTFPPGTTITKGSIQFWAEYDSRLPWAGRTRSFDESFTLDTSTNPPQWTPGKPIK